MTTTSPDGPAPAAARRPRSGGFAELGRRVHDIVGTVMCAPRR